jgi:hypothetical protein
MSAADGRRGVARMAAAVAGAAGLVAVAFAGARVQAAPAGYPTDALADYVFGCMATNGETPDALRRCSCSIDHIADKLSYDEYVQAETVLRMQQVPGGGDQITMFRTSPWAQQMVERLRRAQVEAEAKCF